MLCSSSEISTFDSTTRLPTSDNNFTLFVTLIIVVAVIIVFILAFSFVYFIKIKFNNGHADVDVIIHPFCKDLDIENFIDSTSDDIFSAPIRSVIIENCSIPTYCAKSGLQLKIISLYSSRSIEGRYSDRTSR